MPSPTGGRAACAAKGKTAAETGAETAAEKAAETEAEKAAEWATATEENPSVVCETSSGPAAAGYAESNGRPGGERPLYREGRHGPQREARVKEAPGQGREDQEDQ